jgi:hypothetical protein
VSVEGDDDSVDSSYFEGTLSRSESYASNPMLVSALGRIYPKGTGGPLPSITSDPCQEHAAAPPHDTSSSSLGRRNEGVAAEAAIAPCSKVVNAGAYPSSSEEEEAEASNEASCSDSDQAGWHSDPESRVWPTPPASPCVQEPDQEMVYPGSDDGGSLQGASAHHNMVHSAISLQQGRSPDRQHVGTCYIPPGYDQDSASSSSEGKGEESDDSVKSDPSSAARVWPSPPPSTPGSPHVDSMTGEGL